MQVGEHTVEREDLIIIGFIALMAASIGFMQLDSGEPMPEECQKYVTAIENNISGQGFDVDCKCQSGEEYASQLQTPEKVENVTEISLALSCDINGRTESFLIRRINSSEVLGNQSARVVE